MYVPYALMYTFAAAFLHSNVAVSNGSLRRKDNVTETAVKCITKKEQISESHADALGVRLAYDAYKQAIDQREEEEEEEKRSQFTAEQRFFIAFGKAVCNDKKLFEKKLDAHHAPWRARVVGALRQFQAFGRAFHCPTGSTMNPVDKCTLLGYPH